MGPGGRAEPSTRDTRRLCVESADQTLLTFTGAENEGNLGSRSSAWGTVPVRWRLTLHQRLPSLSRLPGAVSAAASRWFQHRAGQPVQRCLSSLDVNEMLPSKVCSPAFPEDAEELQVAT